MSTNASFSSSRAAMSTAVHQLMEMEREEIKQMVAEEVEKQISIAMKNCKKHPPQSWSMYSMIKNFFYRTNNATLPDLMISTSSDNKPAATNGPVAFSLFDEFVNTYPHYNLDPWEFDFGLLVAIQKLKYSEIAVNELDRYVGMIPTYRHLREQAKAGKRVEPARYTVYIEQVAKFVGYDEGVITVEKLNRFISSSEGKEIHNSFRGYADAYFFVADAGEN